MSRLQIILASSAVLVAAAAVVLMFVGPSVQRSLFYPKPHGLPPTVAQTVEELLPRLQAALEKNALVVVRSLRPGLSHSEISDLEATGGFHLSDDLRALYRWHNGMPTNSSVGLLPGQRFLSLDEVVQKCTLINQQMGTAPLVQRAGFAIFAGHRRTWVPFLDDGAGDGYFYDPERTNEEGAFFCHLAEEGYYLWFPSISNFLLGAIECYESKAIKVSADGHLEEDSERTEKIWARLAKSSEDGK